MTHGNDVALRRAYDSIGVGDLQPMLDLLDPECEWEVGGGSPIASLYRGRADVAQFFTAMGELYGGTLRVTVEGVVGDQRQTVVLTRESAEIADEPLSWTSAHVYEWERGAVVHFRAYMSDAYHGAWLLAGGTLAADSRGRSGSQVQQIERQQDTLMIQDQGSKVTATPRL